MNAQLVCVSAIFDPAGDLLKDVPAAVEGRAIEAYRELADQLAAQHGCLYRSFSGEGDVVLFATANAAVRFALLLIDRMSSAEDVSRKLVRAGIHRGDCTRLDGRGEWIGPAITVARKTAEVAPRGCILATEPVVEGLDLALYKYEDAGRQVLRADRLPARALYRVHAFLGAVPGGGHEETAEAWFLRGASMAGTPLEASRAEAECYRTALRLRPDYPEALNNLGVVLRTQGGHDGAERSYRAALALRPTYPEASVNLGIVLLSQERLAEARECFEAALAYRSDMATAHHGLANVLRRLGEYARARAHFDVAVELRPRSAEVRNDFALLLEDIGEAVAARQQFLAAIALDPDSAETRYNLALLFESEGEPQAAEEQYHAALATRPAFAEAHNNLAVLLHMGGRLNEAERHYRLALELRPNDSEAHFNYALLLNARQSPAGLETSVGSDAEASLRPPIPPRVTPLTAREAEVLRLVAAGHSNREIATRLVLSINTVERHVGNIYLKIGARGRADATAFALRNGLLGDGD